MHQAKLNESTIFTHTNLGAGEPHNAIIELVNMKQASSHSGNPNLLQTVSILAVTARQSASYALSMEPENGDARYFLIHFDAKGAQNARKQIDAPHRILCGAQPYNRFIQPLGFADRPLNGPVR